MAYAIERLAWRDLPIGDFETPLGRVPITLGVGSGLSRRGADDTLWAIADRGPNFKIALALERYGLAHLKPLGSVQGAKIMPRPDFGPTICELKIDRSVVHLVRTLPLRDRYGRAVSGLPIPADGNEMESAFDLKGGALGSDPSGADTEAIAALSDGSFWLGDEYGPSLIKADGLGRVTCRWVPKGTKNAIAEARYPVRSCLPAIAGKRRLNRGFEALALSPDERWLYAVFQSALAHPDKHAHELGRYARIWKIDATTGASAAQFLYPFDPPESFARDQACGEARGVDLKVCDAAAIGENALLLLERISHTAKIYRVALGQAAATPRKHLQARTRPTLEELDLRALAKHGIRPLQKTLVFSTDSSLEISRDLEGMAVLSAHELLLVNDNDFGVEGAETCFWRIRFREPLFNT
jgi:Esterase-like activity of phytase